MDGGESFGAQPGESILLHAVKAAPAGNVAGADILIERGRKNGLGAGHFSANAKAGRNIKAV